MNRRILAVAIVASMSATGCLDTDPNASSNAAALSDPVHESGIVTRNEWHDFGPFSVDSGTISAMLTMHSGDADLYVRVGEAPTFDSYDCRPWLGGNQSELCEFDGPVSIYVGVAGYGWRTTYQLAISATGQEGPVCGDGQVDATEFCDGDSMACADLDSTRWMSGTAACANDCGSFETSACVVVSVCGNATLDEGEACDGKPRQCSEINPDWRFGEAPCLDDCSGWDESACNPIHEQSYAKSGTLSARQWRHYGPFNIADGTLLADLAGSGDADLYLRRDAPPTVDAYDCRSNGATSTEHCEAQGPGLLYVSVYGYATSSDYTIEVTYPFTYTIPEPNLVERSGTVAANEWFFLGPLFPTTGTVQIVMSGLADADLYVRRGSKPSADFYDCRPYGGSTDEVCEFSSDSGDEIWVGVRGYAASSYFEILAVNLPEVPE